MRKIAILGLFIFSLGIPSLKGQGLIDTSAQLNIWYQEASSLMENFQFDPALERLTSCYRYDSENQDYLLKIAYCHQQMGRYRDAKLYYGEVLKVDSNQLRAINALASIATRQANHRQAQIYFQQLISIDSTNGYYFKQAAYNAVRRGAILDAAHLFLEALNRNPEDMESIDQLADIYIALDDLKSAQQIVDNGLNLDQKNLKLLYNRARIYQKQQNHEGVVETLRSTLEQGDTTDYYQMMIGVAFLRLDSLDQGIFHLEQVVNREKADDKTYHYLGLGYFRKDSIGRSKSYFELAIAAGTAPRMYAYQGDLGLLYDKKKQLRKAIEHYKKSVEARPVPEYIFHLAHASDRYYKDKRIALERYQEYFRTEDKKYRNFTAQRIEQLKEHLHFQLGN